VFDFLSVHALGMLDWTECTRSAVAAWPELSEEERRERALALIEARLAALPPGPT
jgi:hypothetical protein